MNKKSLNYKKKNLNALIISYTFVFFMVPPSFIRYLPYHLFGAIRALFFLLIIFMAITKSIKQNGKFTITKGTGLFMLYAINIFVCTVLNTFDINRLGLSLIEGFTLILIFYIWDFVGKKNSAFVIDAMTKYFTFMVILNIISMIAFPEGISQSEVGDPIYWIGNKFATAYCNLFTIALLNIQNNFRKVTRYSIANNLTYKIFLVVLYVCNIFVSVYTECSTGIVATVVMLILFLLEDSKLLKLKISHAVIISLILSVAIVVFQVQQNSDFLKFIIEDVLHENLSLTGRDRIYAAYFGLMQGHHIFGWGFGNTLIKTNVGPINTQNGFLEIHCEYGIIGVILFFMIISLINKKYNSKLKELRPIFWFVFSMFMCAIIEIPFGELFFLGLSILYNSNRVYKELDLKYNGDEKKN